MQDKKDVLTGMIRDFEQKSRVLTQAYKSMEKKFAELNIELEDKNKMLEAALTEKKETYSLLDSTLETMHNGVIAIDINGEITMFNSAAESITGYTKSSVMGKTLTEAFPKNTFSQNSVLDTLNSGENHELDEKFIWRVDNTPVPVKYQSSLLFNPDGILIGAVEIFSDVSRIKKLEEENAQNKTLAALGEMAATLAHEVKNPLGAMGTWARLLDRNISDDDDKSRSILGNITDALTRLNKIVSSMLIFGRQSETAQLRRLDIKPLLDELLDSMEVEILFTENKDITLTRHWDSTPAFVLVDPEKIRQILMNLILNSLHAIDSPGRIMVSAAVVNKTNTPYIRLSVKDTGCGIDEKELETIFRPFHTTKENGTGLGLAIVNKLVAFHRGTMNASSTPGEGTTMDIYLPVDPDL
ncbi:MAG: two-component system sensor histidine kinase NtrB [Fibrobacterota bacterium]